MRKCSTGYFAFSTVRDFLVAEAVRFIAEIDGLLIEVP